MTDQTRDTLLGAIVRSQDWLDALMTERLSSFEQIAENEKLAERHVRFLAPLAYLSPRIVDAIAEGRAPTDLNVSRLARKLSMSWKEQELSSLCAEESSFFAIRKSEKFHRSQRRAAGNPEIGKSALETARRKGPEPAFFASLQSRGLFWRANPRKYGHFSAPLHSLQTRECVAGAGGFEPPYGGIKIRCLTAWRRPSAAPQESRVPRRGGP